MSEYSDIQKAVRVEKIRIWFAWICGAWVGIGIMTATQDIPVWGTVTLAVFGSLGVLATIAAVRMTSTLNRRAERERRRVLGSDYPG
ncbi:hypothetical protein PV755_44600 [Streptomyces caniscabiei]|uniref:hypothetical protein n=1 Tax=Streptomyces caniscabiei TaxID=2746961 RepID=UPI0029A14A78|nr:hypothetical protein [Streptomyces caniscabiei]MDX3515903.1 hypothetical protein [Streptomyces caniscabiei]MDX3725083.1 hypothetical protein [Streptomyces caniscabiei]